jgi:uncharacterized protein
MTEEHVTPEPPAQAQPRWQALGAIDRRVVGVLAEKAKTTPDTYPMSINAIVTGCNQKSNRFPLMQLEADDIEQAVDRLRGLGAVGMIEGYGRVTKYRHYLYEWLGVEKVELAVMSELLLRGAQTEGELRGRASRMEPIPDLSALRPVLDSLKAKGLVLSLTPEGRGHVVSHALYQPRELENLRAQYSQARIGAAGVGTNATAGGPSPASAPTAVPPMTASRSAAPAVEGGLVAAIRRDMEEIRAQLAQLQSEVRDLAAHQRQVDDQLHGLQDALGGP